MSGTIIQTFSNEDMDLLNPLEEDLRLIDIAHSLSNLPRYTGHLNEHWSVAQHSLLTASMLPKNCQLLGLMHDAHEAYIQDVSSPMKNAMRVLDVTGETSYDIIEQRVRKVIDSRFKLIWTDHNIKQVNIADSRALAIEIHYFGCYKARPELWPKLHKPTVTQKKRMDALFVMDRNSIRDLFMEAFCWMSNEEQT